MRACGSAVLLAALGVVSAGAQQTATSSQPPVFHTGVDVVTVDATVVDADGRPVRDLTAHDFSVTVDGQPRTIVSAQFISFRTPAAAASVSAAPEAYATNTGSAAPGRIIAVVLDRGSITPVRDKDVFVAAARFVRGLQPQDRVGLFSIPEGPQIDFTSDREAVASAILRTDGAAHGGSGVKYVGVAEAVEMQRGNSMAIENVEQRECGGTVQDVRDAAGNSDLMMCIRLVQDEAATVATYAHERTRDTVNGLGDLLHRLGTSDTPKTIVLVSDGMVIDGERFVTNSLGPLLAAAHATIFAMKPEASDSDASQPRAPQNAAQERAINETGLETLARLGGGEMFRIIADPNFAFTRLATELSGYYLIGFSPEAHDRDGKQHKIRVDVRPNATEIAGAAREAPIDHVQVRSRTEFSVPPAGTVSDEQIVADLLRSPTFDTSIPFTLTTYAFQDADPAKIRLLVGIQTDREDAKRLAMGLLLIKPSGQPGAMFFQPSVQMPSTEPGRRTYFATMVTDPGMYMLRAALVDAKGRRGSLQSPVRAFMTRIASFRATQLLIGNAKNAVAAAGSIAPTVSGNFTGGTLYAYMELFADTPAAYDNTSVRLDVVPEGGSTPALSGAAILQPAGSDPHDRAAAGSVSLASLAPGSYVARAIVLVDGRPVGEMSRPFRIVRPAAR